jgi:hypothetical protein
MFVSKNATDRRKEDTTVGETHCGTPTSNYVEQDVCCKV